jgi:hypothetical protein
MIEWRESEGLEIGDMVTWAMRPPWWRRLLIRLGLMRPAPLRRFVVTAVSTSKLHQVTK